MKLEEGELVATGAELAAAPAVLDYTIGDLARLPRVPNGPEDQEAVNSFFESVSAEFAEVNRAALATLADPSRIGVLHYTLGEESVSRAILAWGPETENSIVLMVSGGEEGWHIRVDPVETLVGTVSSVLLDGVPLHTTDIRCSVTQESAIVLLAALHLLRESRLLSLLSHRLPPAAFTVEAVEDVLASSGTEDFRWPFFFFDKVLPFSLDGLSWSEILPGALEELAGRDLVEPVEGSNGNTWQLTGAGYRLALAHHHHLTKVGLRITELNDEGTRGHEGLLFVRSLHDLLLYDLAGKEAAIATLDLEQMQALAGEYLSLERPQASQEDRGSQPGAEETRSCPACAARVPSGAAFCPSCGMTIATSKTVPTGGESSRELEQFLAGEPGPAEPEHRKPPPMPRRKPKPKPVPAASEPGPGLQAESEPEPESKEAAPRPGPKFCKNCGGKLKEGAKFCGGCGQKV